MNKRGQTLILFVIILPILIVIMALVVDVGLVLTKKVELNEVSKLVIKEGLTKNYSKKDVEDLFIKNKIMTDKLKLVMYDNRIEVENEVKIKSIFGFIIGIKDYDIKIDIMGYKENEKIKYE